MQETRLARLESFIKEELADLIPKSVKDPRVPPITVTSVKLTADASEATVYISLFGQNEVSQQEQEKKLKEALQGLNSAAGYLKGKLARSLTTKQIPSLNFKPDKGLENSLRVHELLNQIAKEES